MWILCGHSLLTWTPMVRLVVENEHPKESVMTRLAYVLRHLFFVF